MSAVIAAPAERRLFGTDGIRGVAGERLSAHLALRLGAAAATLSERARPRALIVRDTRASGPMLEAALAAGLAGAGVDVVLGGVAPTPAAALGVLADGLDLGVVVSASHNPHRDNGIKFFGADGHKLTDAQEAALEARLDAAPAPPARFGTVAVSDAPARAYARALLRRFAGLELEGRRIVLDCANGAAFKIAPRVFRALGARVTVVGDAPDGRNINAGVGSTHPETLQAAMAGGRYDAGFAFDGDADRVLACDRAGRLLDGDDLLVLAATHLRAAGRLPGDGVAVTAMSNFGARRALAAAGIALCETPVGDRHLLVALRERGWALGAEPSGHLIDRNFAPSGDGTAAALLCLEALGGRELADVEPFDRLPQALVNVAIAGHAPRTAAHDAVRGAIRDAERALAGRGRVLVRPSGTEPLVRVMAEAPSLAEAEAVCATLAAVVSACA
ncbi:Phosphoglucosamine mutase [Baekduia alba]|uniref:phosphoglucosamine mutase n=1 Tax=Baekduia alba TaxID=2997333 RepID=UPI002341914F|nr:phosphoglucosamine mutase [Baekduia alba]WCB91651.1 Phosphoglucosamine mutase [Baekduia alba]